ncbi:General stress protein 69 [Paraliobacillus sp. PM-2]|uniref:aldo/keto reductase n=1 Tax=Paraliobacillus sp. PM-2 TaxID=1462524 RepID=UPI00061CDA46|nr:aldo/keto reductase [Paraliobacillus sp. PM-2]CQR46753.1 General stress protein 69 [Paraliobacillus sp. PM-2]
MKKNQLGNSDLYVSEMGLGCMSLGTDQRKAGAIIDRAIDTGINYLDTADLYDQTVNESIVGQALKGKREQIILASKVGNHLQPDGTWFWDPSKNYIKEQVKASLLRLQTDYIDLYQLHGGTIDDPIDETIEAFEELKQEGIIRYYGISSIRPNVIKEYAKRSSIVSVMMQYSLLDRRPEESMLDFLHQEGISVVTRGSLAKGFLTDQAKAVAENKGRDGYLSYSSNELKTIIDDLSKTDLANESLTSTALRYVLHHPAVASVVTGASSIKQLDDNMSAILHSNALSESLHEQLQKMTKEMFYTNHR